VLQIPWAPRAAGLLVPRRGAGRPRPRSRPRGRRGPGFRPPAPRRRRTGPGAAR